MFKSSLLVGFLSLLSASVYALPQFSTAIGGVSVIQQQNTCTVDLKNNAAWISWKEFNVAQNETVNFKMKPNGLVVNQIVGLNKPSQIDGTLIASGDVVFINHSGIMFGPTAQLDVGGLLATTASITKPYSLDILKYLPGAGQVINQGTIRVALGGFVTFLGPDAINTGKIEGRYINISLLIGNKGLAYWNALGNDNAVVAQLKREGTKTDLENGGTLFTLGTPNAAKTALYPVSINIEGLAHQKVVDAGNSLQLL